ncbi:ferrichrome ABC transporter substrate-binding protein [Pyxidicoccus xibeiensis]|uniref:ferrichrome ABC transporter substrate-binding protein n=1 Tax=Pyxidicoccus xibeiensis TaxID=2906759 RepID=UPI0020A77ECA|nr:ferrichrome ABC transporter substrate-binding protein [Pyxidicoccus xibeiensis]MCP3135905.1 ferrichrome ABC transporter substrate-binding protein [Pyxidicoccus xibeiensis]
MTRRSRLGLTLLLSVLLHAALFWALSRVPSVQPPRPAERQVVELEVFTPPAQPAATPAPRPTVRPSDQAGAPPVRRAERPSPPRAEEPKAQASAERPGTEASKPQASAEEPMKDDAPRAAPERLVLVPEGMLGEGMALTGEPPSTGRTLRNVPGSEPDPKALAAREAEEARVRVDGWAQDSLASARATSGSPHPYFAQLQKDFTKKLVNPPPPDLKVLASRMKREQVEAIQRFGKTGSPYTPKERDHRLEQRNRFQAAVEAGRAANMFMVDVTEPILALAAIVEVRQARDGKLLDLEVIEGSGDPTFDAWAMSQLRDALARAESPKSGGVGIRDDGMRTRWRLQEYLGNPRVQIHLIGVY